MEFTDNDNICRPIPFWSFNEKLDRAETARQVRLMKEAGQGGFFIHARGGLETPYMGEEWFENVETAVSEAEKCGMEPWIYDENGWPSGFADGAVPALGEEYVQKYLRVCSDRPIDNRTIAVIGDYHFYYDTNPFYVDLLDKKVTEAFIKRAYEPYYKRFGNRIAGFFTDEPQLSRDGYPWSLTLPESFKSEYGTDLLKLLPELFYPIGNYRKTRMMFWRLVSDKFSHSYAETIQKWCNERGLKLTGHLLLEDSPSSQITCNGSVMPSYEYFNIPGIDWLGRNDDFEIAALQVGSVAAQLGKEQVLSESFAMCGHGMSFDDMRSMMQGQLMRGITVLCAHLEGYSLRGLRKRDHPPAVFYQQPWWKYYNRFAELLASEGKILSKGIQKADTLLIHPQSSAWACFDAGSSPGLSNVDSEFRKTVLSLEKKHILFHLGDEIIMERHARVENGLLIIGEQKYKRVILPHTDILFDSTESLLREFEASGGKILKESDVPENPVVDDSAILYTERYYGAQKLYFFFNQSKTDKKVNIGVGSSILDPIKGALSEFNGSYNLRPGECLILSDEKAPANDSCNDIKGEITVDGEWRIVSNTPNVLTLDYCDYYFDGELQEKNGYVLNIQERACRLKRPVKIKQCFKFYSDTVPQNISLVCETPEKYRIAVNGKSVESITDSWFTDRSFKTLDISDCVVAGENEVVAEMLFSQTDKVYADFDNALKFENVKNKLSFKSEIEPMYIIGDFGVCMTEECEQLDRGAVRYNGRFSLGAMPKSIFLYDIVTQGFPFFAGELTLERKVILKEDGNYIMNVSKHGLNAAAVSVNGGSEEASLFNTDKLLLQNCRTGENVIRLTIVNNLRNMLGPHHITEGESYNVSPGIFYKEKSIWNNGQENSQWNDGYSFIKTGLEYSENS